MLNASSFMDELYDLLGLCQRLLLDCIQNPALL